MQHANESQAPEICEVSLGEQIAQQLDADARAAAEKEAEILKRDTEAKAAKESLLGKIRRTKKQVESDKEMQAPRWLITTMKVIGWLAVICGSLTVAAYILWDNRDQYVQAWDKYGSHQTNCIFKVGERTMKGTRDYSYRYYIVFNWKFYDMRTVEEKTFIEMPSSASSILAHNADGTHQKLNITDGEPGRYPLAPAKSYSIFTDNGKNAAVVTYVDMCK